MGIAGSISRRRGAHRPGNFLRHRMVPFELGIETREGSMGFAKAVRRRRIS